LTPATLSPLLFYPLALAIAAGAVAAILLPDGRRASFSLLVSLGALALLLAATSGLLAAAAVLMIVTGAVAVLLHRLFDRVRPHEASHPLQDRGYWEGLISVLLLVIWYRVTSGGDWASIANGTGSGSAWVAMVHGDGLTLLLMVIGLIAWVAWSGRRRVKA